MIIEDITLEDIRLKMDFGCSLYSIYYKILEKIKDVINKEIKINKFWCDCLDEKSYSKNIIEFRLKGQNGKILKSRKDILNEDLLWASKWGHLEIVELLIAKGADINTRGWKVNHFENSHDYCKDVEILEKTPIIIAKENNHLEVVNFLLKKLGKLSFSI